MAENGSLVWAFKQLGKLVRVQNMLPLSVNYCPVNHLQSLLNRFNYTDALNSLSAPAKPLALSHVLAGLTHTAIAFVPHNAQMFSRTLQPLYRCRAASICQSLWK